MRRPQPIQTDQADVERDAKRFLIGLALIGLGLAMRSSLGTFDTTVITLIALGLIVMFGGGNVLGWLRAWWLELATGCAALYLLHRPVGVLLVLVACAPVAAIYIDHGARTDDELPRIRLPRLGRPRYWIGQAWHGLAVPGLMALGGLLQPQGWLSTIADLGRTIQRPYRAASQRRWFVRACLNAGIERPPRVGKVDETKAGWKLSITTRPGMPVEWLGEHAEHIATTLRASSVQMHRDHADAANGTVAVRYRDPFAGAPIPWPHRDAERLDLWKPVQVGIDEEGEPVTIELAGHNLFLSGEPGAGKTTALQLIVATAALDTPDHVQLTILDGKEVDLDDWRPRCRQFAGANIDDAIRALDGALAWIDGSRAHLKANGRKKDGTARRGDARPRPMGDAREDRHMRPRW